MNMADRPNQEEEYQFTDFGTTEESSSTRAAPKVEKGDADVMRRRVFMIAGAVIVILILYNIAELVFKKPAQPVKGPEPVSSFAPKSIQPTPPAKIQHRDELAEPASSHSSINESAQLNQTRAELANVTAAISEIRQTLRDLDTKIVDLSVSQKQLSNQVNTNREELNEIKQKKAGVSKDKKPVKTVYYVKAAIKGRAWLKSENGSTITIKIGDMLPGYGQIKDIDPDTGLITINTGETITFSPDDR